jgi:hypothetical protein
MKPLLIKFVNWLEEIDSQRGPCGSAFEQPVPPGVLIQALAMFQWAQSTKCPVQIFTGSISPESLLASLIFRRAHMAAETAIRGKLDDDDFERPARSLYAVRQSKLTLLGGPPPPEKRARAFLGGPLFAILDHAPDQVTLC